MAGNGRMNNIVTLVLAAVAVLAVGAVGWKWFNRAPDPATVSRPPIADTMAFSRGGRSWTLPSTQPESDSPIQGLMQDLAGGVHEIGRDPTGLPVPEGATRLSATVHDLPAARQEHARYLVSQPQDVLQSFYRNRMAEEGWREAPAVSAGSLVFMKPDRHCVIYTRTGGQGTMVTAVVTLNRDSVEDE